MRTLSLYLFSIPLLFAIISCQRDHKEGQEQFRERQEAILEREEEQQEDLDTTGYDVLEGPATETPSSEKPTTTIGDKVVAIKDGDTIVLLINGEEVTVRLYGVDAPEKNQAYGQRAKQFTSDLVFGKQVRLIVNNKDRYGRTVGTVILQNGRSLNEALVRDGYAWHYKAYSKDMNLANAEADARRFKRGLWADPNPVAPWDFRKNKVSASDIRKQEAASTPLPAGAGKRMVYICNSKGATVYHYSKTCSNLKRCTVEVLTVTEAAAIREYGKRADKACSK